MAAGCQHPDSTLYTWHQGVAGHAKCCAAPSVRCEHSLPFRRCGEDESLSLPLSLAPAHLALCPPDPRLFLKTLATLPGPSSCKAPLTTVHSQAASSAHLSPCVNLLVLSNAARVPGWLCVPVVGVGAVHSQHRLHVLLQVGFAGEGD